MRDDNKKILVMGGTRFFGRRLVQLLVDKGHDVTVATRGNTDAGFGDAVRYLTLDRFDKSSLAQIGQQEWDVVYDQICFAPTDAAEAIDSLTGKVGRYIFTSTMAVYDQNYHPDMTEDEFDPATYPIQMGRSDKFAYGEGKRLAEAVFFQQASFPVAAVRFPIVFGPDDYTKRLHTPVQAVQQGDTIQMQKDDHHMCFVSSAEAADFLAWLAYQTVAGPFNACSNGVISSHTLIEHIEEATGQTAVVEYTDQQSNLSITNLAHSYSMKTDRALEAGYSFANLMSWLLPLLQTLAAEKE